MFTNIPNTLCENVGLVGACPCKGGWGKGGWGGGDARTLHPPVGVLEHTHTWASSMTYLYRIYFYDIILH